ncbi:MAG: M1 family metallopeptidase [Bacteroidales bacterium]
MKNILLGAFLLCSFVSFSQKPDSVKTESWKSIYRASATKINDLVNTKLDVSFDYSKSWMYGKAWITLHPHFYPTDSLNLDAKSMNINEVSIVKGTKRIPLKYRYDSLNLYITLDKTYKAGENYTVFINYVAKPNEIKRKGSAAISGGKGLYFINPAGKDKKKPIQIWTQGETESNSGWIPTIDKPNQRQTDEISMTVPDKYQTLSNGILVNRRKNTDGTRTDTWMMKLPHAPYLLMMAVGEYTIIKDSYKGKEVSYYVEKEYAPVARKIFGLTPEMIGFYSKITGVDYPWPKYSQIVARDYVSGAMENTTATLHAESAQQDARQLVDENRWEDIIAHELFHQWFGDYVTCESWSNLTMNESFADFSEMLWEEYKHGKDAGDEHNFNSLQMYLRGGNDKKDLVRFYYKDREDVFDLVSYQKGGRILNMLRNCVGDSAFFKSLNLYLKTKKFNSSEAQDLRLAFEEVTGQDLNWFWNQWYYGSGHPKLDISYDYDVAGKTAKVFIKQTQTGKIFRLPIAVDVYQGADKKRYKVWIEHQADTFLFHTLNKPDLINVDGDKILLCEKTEHKTLDNYIFQYKNAGLYLDRREAIDFAAKNQSDDHNALDFLKTALKDRYPGLRLYTLQKLYTQNDSVKKSVEPLLADMAMNDPKSLVRAGAIAALGRYKKEVYKPLFLKSVNDSSYSIAGSALVALGAIDTTAALDKAKSFSNQHVKGELSDAVTNILYTYSNENDFDSLAARFDILPFGNEKFMILQPFANLLKRVKNPANFMKGIDMIIRFRDTIPEQYRQMVAPYFNGMILSGIAASKQSKGMTEQADYVKSKLPGKAAPPVVAELPAEKLQKYVGDYELEEVLVKVALKDNKTLSLIIPEQPEMELIPLSRDKFSIKYMEGYSVVFTNNDKGEVTDLIFSSPGGEKKATRKK